MPWLIKRNPSIGWYEIVRLLLMWGTVYSLWAAWGWEVTLVSCILLCATFFYDYWDWCGELIGLSLALVSFPLAILGLLIHAGSRETAPLVGVVYALHTGNFELGALLVIGGIVLHILLKIIQGEHKLYCDRWMWRTNLSNLRKLQPPVVLSPIHISVVLCIMALCGAPYAGWDGLVVPVIIGAGWLMAKANETRVFSGVVPYAALVVVQYLWG